MLVKKDKVAIGVFWSFGEQLLRRGISIIVTLLLARFLVPEDFGLLAMMTVFIAMATALMDSGIQQAVIRKFDPDDAYFSTAFYTNLALGAIAYTLLFAAAPVIANFYEEPRLTLLVRIAGIVVLINAFQVIQVAMLSRDLNFKTQMKTSVPAALISGIVAVVMASMGFGVWALITQTLLSALLVVLIYWWRQPWRPIAAFEMTSLKEMYSFGYKLFLSGLLDTVSRNIYILVIAKLFSAGVAGLYFFAERIKNLIIKQLVFSVQKVTYPALSTLQEDDKKLKEGYRKVMQVTTFMLFPAMLMLATLAQPLFELLFPSRWLPAVPYLQLMCIVGVLYPIHSINLNILKVKGRSDLFLGLEVFKKILLFAVLSVSYRYGVIGILLGSGVHSIIAYLPNSYYSKKLIDYNIREQMDDVLPSLGIATLVCLVIYWLQIWSSMPPLASVIVFFCLGAGAYLLLAKVFKLSAYKLAEEMILKRFLSRARSV